MAPCSSQQIPLTLEGALIAFGRFLRERGGPMVVQIAKFDAALGFLALGQEAKPVRRGSQKNRASIDIDEERPM
jgi:hypothetical protein